MSDAVSPFVRDFIASAAGKLFIDGRWVESRSDEVLTVLNPSTGGALATIADADARDVDDAVAAARRSQDGGAWPAMSPRERGQRIAAFARLIADHADDFAQLEALDNGKSVTVARESDVEGTIQWFEYFSGWPTKLQGATIPMAVDRLVYTTRHPVGVVGQIIPWNYPLSMAGWKLAPALAAGCSIVLKPAEDTPLSAMLLGQLATEAGFPAGVLNVLTGSGRKTGAALVDHPGVDKIAFTGSTVTGRDIMRRSSAFVRRLTLELGGNSPNIVLDDADIDAIAASLASAAFANHGQNCCAGTRLFVPRSKQNAVIDAIVAYAAGIKMGPGIDKATQMGPLISAKQKARVEQLIEQGVQAGGDIAHGGKTPSALPDGFFMEPTVIVNAGDDAPIVREEIFGPVVTVLPYDTVDEAVTRANSTEYGLAAGIWTRDLATAHDLARRVKAGTIWINTYNEFSPAVPFGGFKQSGFGREHGSAVLDHYTELKSVWVNIAPATAA